MGWRKGEVVIYVIIYSVVAVAIYTFVIALGIYKAHRVNKQNYSYLIELKELIEEIKNVIKEEPKIMMSNRQYKNTSLDGVHVEPYKETNSMSLSDLLNRKPTDKEYEEILDLIVELIRDTYADYKFMIAKAEKPTDTNFLQIESKYEDAPEMHEKIFRKAIDYGIEMRVLQEKFAERVAAGKVIDLGEDVVVITDDGEYSLPTGISPINSGVEGEVIRAIVTFIHKDNYDEWYKENIKKGNK